ncbi:hypothetical protein ABR738_01015 [Streptomyces sp. Edi4]|uniref:hypothetical protein n=1 Tax=Streptomyces sp. Edi4 TaxID=3162527 RepID=UPI003305AFCE
MARACARGVDVALDVAAGSPGEFVPDGFVAVAGLGLLQRAELAQRLELVGAGRDPHRFAQLGFPDGGGRGVGGELGRDRRRRPAGRTRRRSRRAAA